MLYSHVQVLAQSCPPANRTVSNCKTANPNDAIGAVIKNLIKNNGIDEGIDKAAWLFESGGSFVENGDGTADFAKSLPNLFNYSVCGSMFGAEAHSRSVSASWKTMT